jgi:Iron-containing redox enzyme
MATKALHAVPTATSDFLNHGFQAALTRWNRARLSPGLPGDGWDKDLERDHRMQRLEGAFLEALRAEVAEEAAAAPGDPAGFVAWFESLQETGPGQGDPLFPWLAEAADIAALSWFLEQEAAGEAGFDDLVAMTQVRFTVQAKLELARNYWDEMGRGNPKGMHGPMLDVLVERLGLEPRIETTCWESLALANAMTAMAASRRYAFHSVGALGAIELTAPGRSACTAAGLKRLGFTGRERHYFDLHAVLDVRHSEEWNKEVLAPLVAEDPARAAAIAEGALIRLKCGARCYERYRKDLWG